MDDPAKAKLANDIRKIDELADRLHGHGMSALTTDDWPTLVSALEEYLAVLKGVSGWDDKIAAAELSVAAHKV